MANTIELNYNKIAIAYSNNDFGLGLKNSFEQEFTKIGGSISSIQAFPQDAVDFRSQINKIKNSNDQLKSAIDKRDLFLVEERIKDLDLKYRDLGNSLSRYKSEIAQLRKNVQREISDLEKTHQQKIRELERKISEVQKQIDAKHSGLSKDLTSAEDVVAQIKQEKQSCLDNLEARKDSEMTDVQNFFNNYT